MTRSRNLSISLNKFWTHYFNFSIHIVTQREQSIHLYWIHRVVSVAFCGWGYSFRMDVNIEYFFALWNFLETFYRLDANIGPKSMHSFRFTDCKTEMNRNAGTDCVWFQGEIECMALCELDPRLSVDNTLTDTFVWRKGHVKKLMSGEVAKPWRQNLLTLSVGRLFPPNSSSHLRLKNNQKCLRMSGSCSWPNMACFENG